MDDIHSLLLSMHLIVLYIIDTDGLQAIRAYYYTTYVYGSVVHFCTWAKCIGESCSGTSESQQEQFSPYGSSYKLKGRRGMLLPFSTSSFLFFPFFFFFLWLLFSPNRKCTVPERKERPSPLFIAAPHFSVSATWTFDNNPVGRSLFLSRYTTATAKRIFVTSMVSSSSFSVLFSFRNG